MFFGRRRRSSKPTFLNRPIRRGWSFALRIWLCFRSDLTPTTLHFDELVALATENDVYLGCNCPTKKNPIVGRCHTYLALEFMQKKFPRLKIVVPE
jgi:hypothetical protein